ncbi:MAG TPA: SpoIIE family protein phosphatase [Stellaceae bacterium]|jgi:phosphoserine phosphatase RsbU/P|nr:SpoIIE family protein phosphatase [Stellaceae bacterium]
MRDLPQPIADALEEAVFGERAVAYLQIDDANLAVIGAGGDLANYGLELAHPGQPVLEHAFFLEGLLPLAETPYVMPAVEVARGRSADLHFYRDDNCLWLVLLDVTAERDQSRRMQQKAYEMTLLEEKQAQLNRRLEATNAELRATQRDLLSSREALQLAHDRIQTELSDAAKYVRSLLPPPQTEPFAIDWRFTTCSELGGDAFGYHWIDRKHFALYLLDVCGHGVSPCLMSVGILHVLQSASLRDVDFRDPERVLAALNASYQMINLEDLFFTLWYGVYCPDTRRLDYSSAGHPPALLLDRGGARMQRLGSGSPPIGCMPNARYVGQHVEVPPRSKLYLFSDGAFEIQLPSGAMLNYEEFLECVRRAAMAHDHSDVDHLCDELMGLRACAAVEDDVSIVRFAF